MKPVTELYSEYAQQITDAPKLYSEWLAYLVLSCVVNKNIFMHGGIGNIYPNFYFLVVGPSSIYRKSFSQKIAVSLIREIYSDFPVSDTSSRESFISELAREDRIPGGCGLVVIDEMAGFMARAKGNKHFLGFMQDLSTAFTSDTIERRVGVNEKEKQVFRINEPFLNITAACSFDWLTKSIETSDITGGFLARFMWIVASEKAGSNWSEPKKADSTLRAMILERLRGIQNIIGEIRWSDEAKKMWDAWYDDFRERNQGGKWDANYERITLQVRKIAMLNAAQDLRLHICSPDLDSAISMAEPLIESLKQIAVGDTREEVYRNKILGYIQKWTERGVRRSDLLNNISGLDARSLNDHIRTLVEMEKIEMKTEKLVGRQVETYRAVA